LLKSHLELALSGFFVFGVFVDLPGNEVSEYNLFCNFLGNLKDVLKINKPKGGFEMKLNGLHITLLLIAALLTLPSSIQAQYALKRGAFGNGGRTMSIDGQLQIVSAWGQNLVGRQRNSEYRVSSGIYQFSGKMLSVDPLSDEKLPRVFQLKQNYPNPFNPSTTIEFAIPQGSKVTLIVYDILGRHVATLINEELPAGVYTHLFNAAELASGVYVYRLQAEGFAQSKKFILMK
jgi:hypothetical protein